MKHAILRVLGLAGICCMACASGGITVQHVNRSGLRLADVSVKWDGLETVAGLLPPGVTKTDDLIASRLPSEILVRWRTPDGIRHEQRMSVPPIRGRLQKGELPTIVVTFEEEGIKVSTATS